MKRIREVIVVEGRHDTAALRRFFDCDTIETSGSAVPAEVIERIRTMKQSRGIIIFTDPDAPGNRIRQIVNDAVPGCLNAFIDKEKARTDRKVGVEHADEAALNEALSHLITIRPGAKELITAAMFYELGLSGKQSSTELRRRVGSRLHVGYGNARTMRRRLNCLGISPAQLKEIVENA